MDELGVVGAKELLSARQKPDDSRFCCCGVYLPGPYVGKTQMFIQFHVQRLVTLGSGRGENYLSLNDFLVITSNAG